MVPALARHPSSPAFRAFGIVWLGLLGLTATGHALACAVGDFDSDTHPDLAIAMSDRVILYRNDGDNTFTDVTEKAGIKQINHPAGLTFIDFDHDGDVDLLITGSAGSASTSNVLWRNNGSQARR